MGIFRKSSVEVDNVVTLHKSHTPWMDVAYKELGQKEVPGPHDNPRIIEYIKATHYKPSSGVFHDEIPWCSAFIDWVFDQIYKEYKIKGTNSAGASSWLNWGLKLSEPIYGCVAVKRRKGGNHVTFFVRKAEKNGVPGFIGLGGNQGNRVCEAWYPMSEVRGFMWPKGWDHAA